MTTPAPTRQECEFVIAHSREKLAPGFVKVLRVTIEWDVMSAGQKARIDLYRHPDFQTLLAYMRANGVDLG